MSFTFLQAINVVAYPKTKLLFDNWSDQIKAKSELNRLSITHALVSDFLSIESAHLCPAVPERSDYWYLSQVAGTNSHHGFCSQQPYRFQLHQPKEIWLATNESSNEKIWQMLFAESKTLKDLTTIETLEHTLVRYGPSVLSEIGFDPKQFQLRFPTLDEYLRLTYQEVWSNSIEHQILAGHRVTTDNQKRALLAGNTQLGGSSFIDSWLLDSPRTNLQKNVVISDYA